MRASTRTRLLAALLAVALVAAVGLTFYFLAELQGFATDRLTERLRAQAAIAASLVSDGYLDGDKTLSSRDARRLQSALVEASAGTATRLRVLDANGTALADTLTDGVGRPYSALPEVTAALSGEVSPSVRRTDAGRRAVSVAVPIVSEGRVVGAAYASDETFTVPTLLSDYRGRLVLVLGLFAAVVLALTEFLSRWLSRPLRDLATGAGAFTAGDHTVRFTPTGARETRELAAAFNAMADESERVVAELKQEERRKSRFVSDVSHELRTPLTAIRGAAETLIDGDVPEDEARQFLVTIVREADRLARLANDLLTLQRIEGATGELPLRRLALTDVAARAVEALAPLTDAREITVIVEGESPQVLGDIDRLQQVVANLVDNASRMTEAGGSVLVRLGEQGDRATLEVLDEGPGVPEEALPHLFERFYRAQRSRDRSSGGAGLGLAIVAAIVRAHAGTIEAANRPEGGSVFTIRLPIVRD
jgi:two-component system OmpR family sensor kinase